MTLDNSRVLLMLDTSTSMRAHVTNTTAALMIFADELRQPPPLLSRIVFSATTTVK